MYIVQYKKGYGRKKPRQIYGETHISMKILSREYVEYRSRMSQQYLKKTAGAAAASTITAGAAAAASTFYNNSRSRSSRIFNKFRSSSRIFNNS
jgi:hypothetical protein